MPIARVSPDLEMHYLQDDYTDPWRSPDSVLMLHGNAENGGVWFGWVPWLARDFRLIRPDMRGFGRSTAMLRDYRWDMNVVVDDYVALMDALRVEKFHLIGAKLGGMFARRLAARFPERVSTMTLVGTPQSHYIMENVDQRAGEIDSHGAGPWARRTMQSRLGSGFPAAGAEWWIGEMAKTDRQTLAGFITGLREMDVTPDLPRIRCPTLVITTEGSALGNTEQTRAWQKLIPQSRLLVLPGNSYHVAASDADRCAQEARDFMLSESR